MNRNIGFGIYALYHILYAIFANWIILFAHVYINGALVPDSFRWENGSLKEDQTLFLSSLLFWDAIELGIVLYVFYRINKWFLDKINYSGSAKKLAIITSILAVVIAPALYFIGLRIVNFEHI